MPIDWVGKTRSALIVHCQEAGWRGAHIPKVGPVFSKDGFAIYLDSVGIFLFQQAYGRWVRLAGRGLAWANMRSLLDCPVMTFTDGSTFNIKTQEEIKP